MVLATILVFCIPVGFILLVCVAIGVAGANSYRTGKRAYIDLKPYISELSGKAARIQQKGTDFADRGARIGSTFEEIAGRWAFVTETISESTHSPVTKAVGIAGRFLKK